MTNDEKLKSTPAMDEYIEFVFQKVIELYKDTVPDILARVFEIDLDTVKQLIANDVLKKFDLHLEHRYTESEDPNIQYIDNLDSNLLTNIALGIDSYTPRNNALVMQTNDEKVFQAQSMEDLMKLREHFSRHDNIDSAPISKLISDIDYVTHEMAHAFEHILNANNQSYLYDRYMSGFIYPREEQRMQSTIWNGEQFPNSMERIILVHLQKVRT